MKKIEAHKLLYGAGGLMVLGFFIHLAVDYYKYITTLNSAPFWLWACVDAMLWLIPAALAVTAGYVAKKKLSKKENRS